MLVIQTRNFAPPFRSMASLGDEPASVTAAYRGRAMPPVFALGQGTKFRGIAIPDAAINNCPSTLGSKTLLQTMKAWRKLEAGFFKSPCSLTADDNQECEVALESTCYTQDMAMAITLESELTCPHCDSKSIEIMPIDSCLYFHQCQSCKELLSPRQGDCCVFCSFGTVPCPPIQKQGKCCQKQASR